MVSPEKNIKDVKIEGDGTDIFVVYAGVKIAKRGHPGTPQAGTWISLEPGWTALDCKDESAIEISYKACSFTNDGGVGFRSAWKPSPSRLFI